MVPWVATTVTSTTTLLALVKGATEYLCRDEKHSGGKRGERRRERRRELREWAGRGVTRKGTAKYEVGASREGCGGRGEKRNPLVGDVQTYGTAYKWYGAD